MEAEELLGERGIRRRGKYANVSMEPMTLYN
jgi:hypothetical protein